MATYLVSPDRRILLWNDACERLTGRRREEVLGHCCAGNLLLHCDESGAPLCGAGCPLLQAMHDGNARSADLFLRHKAGHRVPVRVRAAPIRDEHGAILGACECFDERPMSLPPQGRIEAVEPAELDDVTRLPSRHITERRLESEMLEFGTNRIPFGVLCLAIDGVNRLCANDGGIAVDRVLFETAQTLARLVGPGNFAGRWTGDGFLAILRGCSEAALAASAATIGRLAAVEAVPWWGDFLTITISAGGTVVRPGDTAAELARRAETALEQAKKQGANRAVVV